MSKNAVAVQRGRNWASIVYPESAPSNWMQLLEDEFVPVFISPLHDRDIETEATGEAKKEHYHVMIMFSGNKSHVQIKEIFDKIGGVGAVRINDIRAYARYLCHLDSPHKAQYDISEVISMGGADYHGTIDLPSDKYSIIGDMLDYCYDNEIDNYSQLLMYARNENLSWFKVLCDSGTYVIKEYMKSLSYMKKLEKQKQIYEELK